MAYQIVGGVPTERIIGAPAELIIAGVVAAVVLVTLDLAQIVALQFALGRETASRPTWSWVARTARAQILWGLAAVITVEVVVIEPWFLVPGIPLFLLGYIDIRARFAAERRARLLETLVEVGRSVGGAVDPTDVFRGVYRSVTSVMDADAFYVATLGRDPEQLRYRFLVDDRRELEPVERVKSGTLAGACIERKRPGGVARQGRRRARVRGDDRPIGARPHAPAEGLRHDRGGPRRSRRRVQRALGHAREHAHRARALRPQSRARAAAARRRRVDRRALRHLAGAARAHRRGARARRHPRWDRRAGDPRHPSLPRARRGAPLDRVDAHAHDPGARPVPRGPPAPPRRGRGRARGAARLRRRSDARPAVRLALPVARQDRHPGGDRREDGEAHP